MLENVQREVAWEIHIHIGFKVLLQGAKGSIAIETTIFPQEWGIPVDPIWGKDSGGCQSEQP